MPNAEKVKKVATLKEQIEGANALLLAEYRGLSVHDATELRRSMSEEARFSIVKNTLFQRAAADAGVAELETLMDGPTAVAFVDGDVVATAKKVVDAAKKFPALVLKGGYLDGKILSAAEAQALATLESREVLLSKVAGMMKAEMVRAASMFQAIQGRFLGVLEAYKDKLPAEAEAEEPAAEAEAAAATGTDTAEAAPEAGGEVGAAGEADTADAAPADAGGEVEAAGEADTADAAPADASVAEADAAEGAPAPEGETAAEAHQPTGEANDAPAAQATNEPQDEPKDEAEGDTQDQPETASESEGEE